MYVCKNPSGIKKNNNNQCTLCAILRHKKLARSSQLCDMALQWSESFFSVIACLMWSSWVPTVGWQVIGWDVIHSCVSLPSADLGVHFAEHRSWTNGHTCRQQPEGEDPGVINLRAIGPLLDRDKVKVQDEESNIFIILKIVFEFNGAFMPTV